MGAGRSAGGPYGTPASGSACAPCRQRRASIRTMSTVATPSTAYTTITAVRVSMTPPLVVAACAVVISWYTTHGWRPTSVTIQPHSIATSAAGPQAIPSHQNHDCRGRPRRRRHTSRAHSPAASSKNASPTIASKDRWIRVSAGGR